MALVFFCRLATTYFIMSQLLLEFYIFIYCLSEVHCVCICMNLSFTRVLLYLLLIPLCLFYRTFQQIILAFAGGNTFLFSFQVVFIPLFFSPYNIGQDLQNTAEQKCNDDNIFFSNEIKCVQNTLCMYEVCHRFLIGLMKFKIFSYIQNLISF